MEEPKKLTVREIADILGPYSRDLVNQNYQIANRIRASEELRDAINEAVKIAGDTGVLKDKLEADIARMTQQKSDMERGIKKLNDDLLAAKERTRAANEEAQAAEQKLAALQGDIESATAHISRGQEAQRILASLANH
jgi:chromosome segregation ATPase